MNLQSEILLALKRRYATKVFDSQKLIDSETFQVIQQIILLSPSSYGLQPYQVLVVDNKKIREELRIASRNQSQVTDASHYIVFVAKKNVDEKYLDEYIAHIAEVRGVSIDSMVTRREVMHSTIKKKNESEMLSWNSAQAYLALGNLITASALLGIDTCPMEGFEKEKYNKILNLTDYSAVVTCALGYRKMDDSYATARKVRFPIQKIFQSI